MNTLLATLLILPALVLLAAAILPSTWVNSASRGFRRVVTFVAGAQFLVAATMATAQALGFFPVIQQRLLGGANSIPVGMTVYYDGVASLMLALVSFVGWVICRYSVRYLDGESSQGRYFKWTSFTIGAVSLMVISGNLLMFFGAWVMTSLGLHQLLMHYSDRPAARRAAWTKFTVSRIGDAAIISAITMIYIEFKTFEFVDLFTAANSGVADGGMAMHVAGILLIIGAITKSAQVPFHTWLPLTMETPTPVSALMHAGVVNAGGYLIIRMSPLVALAPGAMATLAIFGAATACYAAIVMVTQTSVKKKLAYSTIAQMGFMLLQCGLGAFSTAMLHILAHSLYKAHAFLSSGSILSQQTGISGVPTTNHQAQWSKLLPASAAIIACYGISLAAFGISPTAKPGVVLLGGILCLALTSWVGQAMRMNSRPLLVRSFLVAGLLCIVYVASFSGVDKLIAASLPEFAAPAFAWTLSALIAIGFGGLFLLQTLVPAGRRSSWKNAWYVHASNGFYLENFVRRISVH